MIRESRHPLLGWAGAGCALVLLLAVVAVLYSVCTVRRMKDLQTDPAARDAEARAILGASTLPRGYRSAWTVRIPAVADAAVLTDAVPDAEGRAAGPHRGGFIYVRNRWPEDGDRLLRQAFRGEIELETLYEAFRIRAPRIGLRPGIMKARGTVEREDVTVRYVSHDGWIRTGHGNWARGRSATLLLECPGEGELRLGIWYESSVAEAPGESSNGRRDGPDDPDAIEEFASHLSPCI